MWCLADIEVRIAKTEECDCLKKISVNKSVKIIKTHGDINKSAKITRRLRNLMLRRSQSAIETYISNSKNNTFQRLTKTNTVNTRLER
jgi:hypothetical protein